MYRRKSRKPKPRLKFPFPFPLKLRLKLKLMLRFPLSLKLRLKLMTQHSLKAIILLFAMILMPIASSINIGLQTQPEDSASFTKSDETNYAVDDLDIRNLQTQASILTDARSTSQLMGSRNHRVLPSTGPNPERTVCRFQFHNKFHSLLFDCFGESLHPRSATLFAPASCLYYVYWLRRIIR